MKEVIKMIKARKGILGISAILILSIVFINIALAVDKTPPASITNLKNISYATSYINWTWKDPATPDFAKVMVYIDGKFKKNVTKGTRYYNATSLLSNTKHTISTRTVDSSGNVNKTWRNHTALTAKIITPTPTPTPIPPPSPTPSLGVFYYPWTGGNPVISPTNTWKHWKDGNHNPPSTWDSHYLPDLGPSSTFDPYNRLYSAKDTNIINKQLGLMKQAGIGFVISSWWGQNSYEDQALDVIFTQVLPSTSNPYPDAKFAIYYEKEGFADVPISEIISDINYIKTKYASSSYYYKINGKPVIFVYNADSGGLADAQKWKSVRDQTGIYTVLKVFSGYQTYADLADSWHQYAPAHPGGFEQQDNYSALITPGFHKWNEQPRLTREDFVRWENNVAQLKNANVQFKLIETWNEWGEGTGIEPAQKINHDDVNGFTPAADSYGTKYIDILSKYFSVTS